MNIDTGTALVLTYVIVNVGITITCLLAAFAICGLLDRLGARHNTGRLHPEE